MKKKKKIKNTVKLMPEIGSGTLILHHANDPNPLGHWLNEDRDRNEIHL